MAPNLDDFLRAGGLRLNEVAGWETRRRPGDWAPVGVMLHHTAGVKSLAVIVNGRSDLPGPLANFHVPKDGSVNLVSAGRCNHAGAGAQAVLDRVRLDLAPLGDARVLGYPDGPVGNGRFYGIEAENLGDGIDPWPAAQINTIALLCALLDRRHGWGPDRLPAHREWTSRKPDPRGIDMVNMRARVRWLLATTGPQPTPPPVIVQPAPMVHHWTDEEGTALATQPIKIELDNEGRGNEPTGIAMERFVSASVEAGVRPNVDGWYPGDPGHPRPACWPSNDGGQITVIAVGGAPNDSLTVWLTTRA